MNSNPGNTGFYLGALLLAPIVFFGLGLIGFGEDYLTNIVGSFTLAKLVLGSLVVLSVTLMVNGFLTMRDGVIC